jgi:HSP20 family protein
MSPLRLDATEDSFERLSRRLGKMMDELSGSQFFTFSRNESWRPALNLYETDTHFIICVDLAGMPRDRIDIRAEPGRIVIRGDRADPKPPGERPLNCVHRMEIDVGPFYREVALPATTDVDRIQATYREGFLWIHAPKNEAP